LEELVMTSRVLCFGELLMRLSAPGHELLLQSARLDACFGGAEVNVALSLAQFGHSVRLLTAAPDNALGDAGLRELRRHGVATEAVRRAPGRLGLYFLTPGAVRRPSDVLYDRAGSVFAETAPHEFDIEAALEGCGWLHVSGVTPAVGRHASACTLALVAAAKAKGVKVSFDGNYRAKMWAAWRGDGPEVLRQILRSADLLFGDERDVALALGTTFQGDLMARRGAAAAAAFAAFPHLERLCGTVRVEHGVDDHDLSATLHTRQGGVFQTKPLRLSGIVDRIGAGDAFAAGVLHGLLKGWSEARTLAFGLGASAFKHSVPGDFNLAGEAAILQALDGDDLSVRR
jgi:2-dehydro-3-deoxygluconokinase